MINNKTVDPIETELLFTGRKLNISFVFITKSYFKVPKDVGPNSAHFSIMKIPNESELAINHSSGVGFKDFMKVYEKCAVEPYSFLVNDTTLPLGNLLRFRKNLLK